MTQLYFKFMNVSDIRHDRGLEQVRRSREELLEAFKTGTLYEWCASQVEVTRGIRRNLRGLGLQPGGW